MVCTNRVTVPVLPSILYISPNPPPEPTLDVSINSRRRNVDVAVVIQCLRPKTSQRLHLDQPVWKILMSGWANHRCPIGCRAARWSGSSSPISPPRVIRLVGKVCYDSYLACEQSVGRLNSLETFLSDGFGNHKQALAGCKGSSAMSDWTPCQYASSVAELRPGARNKAVKTRLNVISAKGGRILPRLRIFWNLFCLTWVFSLLE